MLKKLFLFFIFTTLIGAAYHLIKKGSQTTLNNVQDWFILLDYNDDNLHITDYQKVKSYGMVILDPDSHPPISLLPQNIIKIAYISLGEAETYRSYWSKIAHKPWVIAENENWAGNYFIDISSSEWQELIINSVIPNIIEKGFQGLFLDTLDTAYYLAKEIPGEKYHNSKENMILLVRKIKESYPDLMLISNNGFFILDEIAPYLSAALSESIYMGIDFENNSYKAMPASETAYKIERLLKIQSDNNLPIFIIDYTDDVNIRKTVSAKIKELNFKPYIARKRLNNIYEQ